jgi:cytochrome oxidase Cu insertion factor (SCO1/SenC/PrrC family)
MSYRQGILCGFLGLLALGLHGCTDGGVMIVGIEVGNRAPDFALSDTDGRTVRLADYLGRQPVVLVFYRTSG